MSEEMRNTQETVTEQETGTEETKVYTYEEVQKLLQSEADKRVTEALKKADKKKEIAVKEAEKLAKMNADEKFQYELEQREKKIAEKEAQLALAENRNEASKILADKGISIALVDFVVAEDADTMMNNINTLDKEFKKSVRAEVEKRLAGSTPKKNLGTDAITKEGFKALSLAKQSALLAENPSLYEKYL